MSLVYFDSIHLNEVGLFERTFILELSCTTISGINSRFKWANFGKYSVHNMKLGSHDGTWHSEYNGATFVSHIMVWVRRFLSTKVIFDKPYKLNASSGQRQMGKGEDVTYDSWFSFASVAARLLCTFHENIKCRGLINVFDLISHRRRTHGNYSLHVRCNMVANTCCTCNRS